MTKSRCGKSKSRNQNQKMISYENDEYNEETYLLKDEHFYYEIMCFNCQEPMFLWGCFHSSGLPDTFIYSCKKCEIKVRVDMVER
jgi:hypothetical protein